MRKGEQSCSHGDEHPSNRQPAWPLASAPEITNEDHYQKTSNVKAANQQSWFWTYLRRYLFSIVVMTLLGSPRPSKTWMNVR